MPRRPTRPSGPGFVYLIAGGGLMKIGRAVNVGVRLETLQACSPVPLGLLGEWPVPDMHAAEGWLHRFFADARRHGEWFAIEDAEAVENAIGLYLDPDPRRTTLNVRLLCAEPRP